MTDKTAKPRKAPKKRTPPPFANAGFSLAGLTVDSASDRISITGSTDITRDQAGLARAKQLAQYFQAAAQQLEKDSDTKILPDTVPVDAPQMKDNPFE